MTLIHVTIDQLFRILQISGTFTCTWPEFTGGKCKILLRHLGWTLTILNAFVSMIAIIFSIWHTEDDIIVIIKTLSELTALIEMILNTILCRLKRVQLQIIIQKFKDFMKHSKSYEKLIIQKYIHRYSNFCLFVVWSFAMAAICFSCGPVILSTKFPMESWYPFSTDSPYIRSIIYILQAIAILQTGVGITVDLMIAMFLWFPAARLEMLNLEIQRVTCENEVKMCIQKHQEIISLVDEIQSAVKYLLCKVNITMALTVIFGAFPLLYNQPLAVTSQFLCMVICGCQRLYVTAWPADDLIINSQQLASSAYNIPWYERIHGSMSNVFILIQRSRKPLEISLGSIFPVMSLQYYGNFLKTIGSYFMTIRAAIDK